MSDLRRQLATTRLSHASEVVLAGHQYAQRLRGHIDVNGIGPGRVSSLQSVCPGVLTLRPPHSDRKDPGVREVCWRRHGKGRLSASSRSRVRLDAYKARIPHWPL